MKKKSTKSSETQTEKEDKVADLKYPASDDIYTQYKKISLNEEGSPEIEGNGLDVPGSELDDKAERIGEEDEENNYYSLGGDDHKDLDESSEDGLAMVSTKILEIS